ncbi:MAG: hypothetical protein HFJ86_03260 [Oscillospiraceae bacterium]|jgi:hypothetical protein|nr:hypothetical protein [Oscillospiraceae bacterium]
MRNIEKPKTVSLETALQNLVSRLTGAPAAGLPRTQEGLVQYLAEHLPSLEELRGSKKRKDEK